LFGLFQGGIVSAYAIIVREYFPAKEAGSRVGVVSMASLLGKVLDLTGSDHAVFINGVLWNALNLSIALWLLWRVKRAALQPACPGCFESRSCRCVLRLKPTSAEHRSRSETSPTGFRWAVC
jgi:hypothetical protein